MLYPSLSRPSGVSPQARQRRIHAPEDPPRTPLRPADPLSFIFNSIQITSFAISELRLTAPWGIRLVGGVTGLGIVLQGHCLLEVDGLSHPTPLQTGDLVVMPHGHAHQFRDSLTSPVRQIDQILPKYPNAGQSVVRLGGGGKAAHLLFGELTIDMRDYAPWFSMLPTVIPVHAAENHFALHIEQLLQFILEEQRTHRPGFQYLIGQLTHILFMQTLRLHFTKISSKSDGILPALADPQIGSIIQLLHLHMKKPWSVASLASEANMSRSAFAQRFTQCVGQPPLRYLLGCRMTHACSLLRETNTGLKGIASQVGYSSVSTFANAFKRWAGMTPSQYRGKNKTLGQHSPTR